MFVREIKKPNGSSTIAIVESIRVDNKVVQKVIRTFGTHKDEREISIIKEAAEKVVVEMINASNPVLPGFDPTEFHVKKSRSKKTPDQVNVDGLEHVGSIPVGVQEVFSPLITEMGFDTIIKDSNKDIEWNENLKKLVLARIEEPTSKLNTSEFLERDHDIILPVQKIYRTMDKVSAFEDQIKERIRLSTLTTLDQKINIMFYDVTTLYFESFRPDELRHQGFSKDCKFKETQVVLALATTTEGLPLTYELFPGNTSEGKTLLTVIEKMKFKYGPEKILLVADRAMFNEINLSTLDDLNVEYIVAAKLKALPKEMKDKITSYKEKQRLELKYWHTEYEFKDRRLIVNFTEDRKNKDEYDRKKLVERLEKKLKNKTIPVSELITNNGTKKYVNIKVGSSATINTEKIDSDKKWDGLHGVITNKNNHREVEEILQTYKGLWQIEEAFRITKTDLKVRPIYHWKPSRIKAHIAICFMAYTLLAQLRYRLKKNGIELSPRKIKDELNRVVKVKIRNKTTQTNIVLPSKLNDIQKSIYSTLKIKTQLQKAIVL
jgi:transposase